jgi:hypothetical protein
MKPLNANAKCLEEDLSPHSEQDISYDLTMLLS